MNQARVIYHLARADFLERVRRYSFLILLGLMVFLGYQVAIGNVSLRVGSYRGEYNSAWVGSMMSVVASFFLGWLGFYLVKGSLARDRETGVGQIIATTPLTRPVYTLGKWISNFEVLFFMVIVLAIASAGIQVFAGENNQLELVTLFTPFIFITLPMLAFTAAVAVLFESIGFLRRGLGNLIYFFLFMTMIPLFGEPLSKTNPAFEPLGAGLLTQSVGTAARAAFPDYAGGFMLGSTDTPISGVFHWSGVAWTPDVILKRITFFGIAILLTLLASIFFDRFDPSRSKPVRRKNAASPLTTNTAAVHQTLSQPVHLTPQAASKNRFAFIRLLISELKLLLKGQPWWWYAVGIGLFIASLVSTPETLRASLLPLAWLWPILIWSGMGNRELRHNTHQMVFSSGAPLLRQLPAAWLAGFIVAILAGSGAALKLLSAGDPVGLLAWLSGALFIPSLALALGVWSNSSKVFEVLYVSLWYIGPMNKINTLDYLGANGHGNPGFFIPFSILLIALAFIGRARQLQN